MFLPNHSTGKSMRPQQRNQTFTANEPQPTHAAKSETPGVRNKRQVPTTRLRTVCPPSNCNAFQRPSVPSQSCVKHWFYCSKYNLFEAECVTNSFACLHNIALGKPPGCSPEYSRKIEHITLGNGTKIGLRLITGCSCPQ